MAFLRFVLGQRHSDSGVEVGLFELAYVLRDTADVDPEQREELRANLEWFEKNLPTPDRFNRSSSKGYYRRNTRGIAWFRDSATECVARMHRLKWILEASGHAVWIIREERVGYLVYEDDLQVIAEPFAETQKGG